MRECLDADVLLTIGDALAWEVEDGVRHLQQCEECRLLLEDLRLTRDALAEEEAVEPDVAQRIVEALRDAARDEADDARRRWRWSSGIESLAAGVTALVIVASSGVRIESVATGVLAFALGATMMSLGKLAARGLPSLGYEYADD